MELDEMKAGWHALEERLARQEAVNRELLAQRQVDRVRTRLRWFMACRAVQIALAVALVAWIAPYWIAHRGQPALLWSGIALHLYGVALAASGILEALVAVRVQHAGPVLQVQRYVGYLKGWRARIAPWLGLSHWLLWIAMALVLFDVALGVDLWAVKPRLVLAWLAFGGFGLALTVWLLTLAPASVRKPLRAGLKRSSIGATLLGVDRLLDEVDRFEQA